MKTGVEAAPKKTEDISTVVSGPTNIQLFLSKEPETLNKEMEGTEEIVRIYKVSSQMVDRHGEIERSLVEDLQKVKHKWPDNFSISRIEKVYQCPDSDNGNSTDSLNERSNVSKVWNNKRNGCERQNVGSKHQLSRQGCGTSR